MGTQRTRVLEGGEVEFLSKSAEETQQLGQQLGTCLSGGGVIGLVGELGSGKTTFIQGLAEGLGIAPDLVRSPTFVLLREYPGRIPLVHLDGYRLEGAGAVMWLDLDWLFSPKKVTVIEWANRCEGVLPDDRLELRLAHKSTNQRLVTAAALGARAAHALESWRASHAQVGAITSEGHDESAGD